MRKEQKNEKMIQYDQAITDCAFAILVEYNKLKVDKVDAFRATLADLDCGVIVLKNTLARIVFERHEMQQVCEYLAGPSMLIYGVGEVSQVAKALNRFMRENPAMQIKAIIFDGQTYPKTEFQTFISMPTKDEIRARFLALLQAPLTRFVQVVNAPQRLANVLKAYVDQAG